MRRPWILAAIAASVIATAGCASTGNNDTAQAYAQETRRLAMEANEKATAAQADAAAARTAAEAAAKDAQEANAKADRIFQRSLKK